MRAIKPTIVEVDVKNIKLNDIVGYYSEEDKGVCLGKVTNITISTFEVLCGNTKRTINKDNIIIHYSRQNSKKGSNHEHSNINTRTTKYSKERME